MDILHAIIGLSSSLGRRLSAGIIERGGLVCGTWRGSPPDTAGLAISRQCDVSDLAGLERFANECRTISDRISLVNLAGISRNMMSHRLELDDWQDVIRTNLTGSWMTARAFLPGMREAGWGRIVFAGSVTGRLGVPGTSAYSASKEGLKGLARTLARENVAKGITVNCIELGYMDAGLTHTIPQEIREGILEDIPARRFGDPANLLETVLFLDAADYVTGAVIPLTGGL